MKTHRMYRHRWKHLPKEITVRDCQAMRNFAVEGISLETIAQHFGCSVDRVSHEVNHRPWLASRQKSSDLGEPGAAWWESDHKDPLHLVKLYYSQYLPFLPKSTETTASEMIRREFDWGPVLAEAYGDDYTLLPDERKREVIEWAETTYA